MTITIDDLPDMVMECIFTFLDPSFLFNDVQFVNKRWNSLLRGSSLWNLVRSADLDEYRIGRRFAKKVLKKCRNLEHLGMVMRPPPPSSYFSTSTRPYLPRLQSTIFYYTYVKMEKTIIEIIKSAPNLRRIKVDGKMTQALVDALSDLKELSYIDLRQDHNQSKLLFLTQLYHKCSKLEVIKLRGGFCPNTEDLNTLKYFSPPSLKSLSLMFWIDHDYISLISSWTALSELSIYITTLTEDSLKLIQKMSSLTSLTLYGKSHLSSDGLERFFEHDSFPKLKKLGLLHIGVIRDSTFDVISHKYPNLEAFELAEYTLGPIEGFRRLIRRCSCIRVLKLCLCANDSSLLFGDLSNHLLGLTYLELNCDYANNTNFSEEFLNSHPNYQSHEYDKFDIDTDERKDLFERHRKCPSLPSVLVIRSCHQGDCIYKIVHGYHTGFRS